MTLYLLCTPILMRERKCDGSLGLELIKVHRHWPLGLFIFIAENRSVQRRWYRVVTVGGSGGQPQSLSSLFKLNVFFYPIHCTIHTVQHAPNCHSVSSWSEEDANAQYI